MSSPESPRSRRVGGPRRAAKGIGGNQLEGRQAVRELLRVKHREVREVLVEKERDPSAILDEIAELATNARIPLRFVSKEELAARSRTEVPQGVIAFCRELLPTPLEELASLIGAGAAPGFVVVLDKVLDPHNLGTIMRSALSFGATGIVLSAHGASSVTPTVAKAAAGAIEHLRIALVPGAAGALVELRRSSIWTVGLDAAGSVDLSECAVLSEPLALVIGSEGRGLSPLVKARCDVMARIALLGPLASLNASIASAIACYVVATARAKHSAP